MDDAPAQLKAEERFVPFGNEIWSRPPIEQWKLISGPQIRWFQTPQGMVAFVWNAERYDTETSPVFGKIALPNAPQFASISAWDIQSGVEVPLEINSGAANLTVDRVPVSLFPVAVLFRNAG